MKAKFSLLFVLLLFSLITLAQNRTVTGRVTDENGKPVEGASVIVKGTNVGVSANTDGVFKINAKSGDMLVVSSTNFGTKEIKIGNAGDYSVSLLRQANVIDEVVVTALGISRQKKELGYSATTVQSKDIVVAKPTNLANGLQGKVSGLQINTVNNGVFAPSRITLRGNKSLLGNNQPLIVVDGAIFYNDISSLNPEDVSEVNILKGASASAVYGSDASNGVLVVTTKHGTKGKPVLTFSTTAQFESVSYMPKEQHRFGSNGGEFFVNDYTDLSTYVPYENQSYGPEFNGKKVPLGRPVADGGLLQVPYSYLDNEKKDFFNVGLTTQNNLSYSAGDENSRFYMSLQDVNMKAVMPKDIGKRDALRVSGSRGSGIFSANYSLGYTYTFTNLTNTGTVYDNVMNVPGHVPLTSLSDWQNNKYADLNGFYNDYQENPYWDIDNYRNKTTDHNFTGNVQFNLKPAKWINLSYRLSATDLSRRYEYTTGTRSFSDYAKTNTTVIYSNSDGTGLDTLHEAAKSISTKGLSPTYVTSNYSNFLLTSDFIAAFDHAITKQLSFKATVGSTYIDNKQSGQYTNAGNLFFPVYNVNSLTGTPTLGGNNFFAEARKLGFFGEATVGFRNYAFVHGSYRTDIDSRLSKDNRFIPYYDIDASLILSDMLPALISDHGLSFIKLRIAHSLTGNASALGNGSQYIAGGAYVINPTLSLASGFPYNGIGGFLLNTTIANPNIKPEAVTENEVGLELGFLRNRFMLTAVAYRSELKDGIVSAKIPSSSGFTAALLNAAHTQNQGLEFELKASLIRKKELSWNLNINYTHNESKVLSINGDLPSIGINGPNANAYAVVGYSYPVIQSRDWKRDPDGHVIVDPISGNPSLDPTLKVLGQASPKDILGISTSLSWKNFSFSATADYRGGHKIFNSLGQQSDFTGISTTSAITGRQRFVFPNSVVDAGGGKYVPNTNVTVDDANFNFWPGLYRSAGANYVISAAAWKLREVSISYDIPHKVYAATKIISRAAFSISGRNLLMFRPKTNVWTDPEFNEDTGNDIGRTSTSQSPPTRIISGTLTLSF